MRLINELRAVLPERGVTASQDEHKLAERLPGILENAEKSLFPCS